MIFDPQNDRINLYDSFGISLEKGIMSINVPISASCQSSRPYIRAKTIQYKHANYRLETYKFSQMIDDVSHFKINHKPNDNHIQS